jgi:hypothetical protein
MSADTETAVNDLYPGEPGKAVLVKQALAERANSEAYGSDPAGPEKRLRTLGYDYSTREAAERRKAAAEETGAAEARTAAPRGRTSRTGKLDTAGGSDDASDR